MIAVILAAGKGSRFELGETIPKCALSIKGKTIIERQLLLIKSQGIKKVIIVVGHLKKYVKHVCEDGKKFGVSIKYIEQKKQTNISNALKLVEKHVSDPFLLLLGDIFFVPSKFEKIFNYSEDNFGAIVATAHDKVGVYKNFAVYLKNQKIVKVVEKPKDVDTDLKGVGIYVLSKDIFKIIKKEHKDLTESIQCLIESGKNVYSLNVTEYDKNITTMSDFVEAQDAL